MPVLPNQRHKRFPTKREVLSQLPLPKMESSPVTLSESGDDSESLQAINHLSNAALSNPTAKIASKPRLPRPVGIYGAPVDPIRTVKVTTPVPTAIPQPSHVYSNRVFRRPAGQSGAKLPYRPPYFPQRVGNDLTFNEIVFDETVYENSQARQQAEQYYQAHGNSVLPYNGAQNTGAISGSRRTFTVYRDTPENEPERSDYLHRSPQKSSTTEAEVFTSNSTPRQNVLFCPPQKSPITEADVPASNARARQDLLFCPPQQAEALPPWASSASSVPSHRLESVQVNGPHTHGKVYTPDLYRDHYGYLRDRSVSQDAAGNHSLPTISRERGPTGNAKTLDIPNTSRGYADERSVKVNGAVVDKYQSLQDSSVVQLSQYQTEHEVQNSNVQNMSGNSYEVYVTEDGAFGQAYSYNTHLAGQPPVVQDQSKEPGPQPPSIKCEKSFWNKLKMKKPTSLESLTAVLKSKKLKLVAKLSRASKGIDSTKVNDNAESGVSQSRKSPRAFNVSGLRGVSYIPPSLEISRMEAFHCNQSHWPLEIADAPPSREAQGDRPRWSFEISPTSETIETPFHGRNFALEAPHNNEQSELSDDRVLSANPVAKGRSDQEPRSAQAFPLPNGGKPAFVPLSSTDPLDCIFDISRHIGILMALAVKMNKMKRVQQEFATVMEHGKKPSKRHLYGGIKVLPELLRRAGYAMDNNNQHGWMMGGTENISAAFMAVSKQILDFFSVMIQLALPKSQPKIFKLFNKRVFFELSNTRDALEKWTETADAILFPVPSNVIKIKLGIQWSAVQKAELACDMWELLSRDN